MNPILLALSTASAAPLEAPSPELALERAEQAFDVVDATEDQRSAARVLLEDQLPALFALRAEGRGIHDRIHGLFQEPTIDREALETTRMDAVDWFDRTTTIAFGLFADVAEVFTPEQRAILHDHRQRMRDHWTHWRD